MRQSRLPLEETPKTLQPDHISLSHQQTEEAVALFKHYDMDNNGSISKSELKKIMTSFEQPLTEKDIEVYFGKFDMNDSDGIDFHEFLNMIRDLLAQKVSVLAESKVLGGALEIEELRVLTQYFSLFLFAKDQVLQKKGDPVEAVTMVMSGVALATKEGEKELLAEGSIYGATHGTNLPYYDTEVVAQTNGVGFIINTQQVGKLVSKHPLVALKLNQAMDYKLTSIIAKFTR